MNNSVVTSISANITAIEDTYDTIVSSGRQGPPGPNKITTASDIDVSGLGDGSVLVYRAVTSKWQATTLLDQQILEGGHF